MFKSSKRLCKSQEGFSIVPANSSCSLSPASFPRKAQRTSSQSRSPREINHRGLPLVLLDSSVSQVFPGCARKVN